MHSENWHRQMAFVSLFFFLWVLRTFSGICISDFSFSAEFWACGMKK